MCRVVQRDPVYLVSGLRTALESICCSSCSYSSHYSSACSEGLSQKWHVHRSVKPAFGFWLSQVWRRDVAARFTGAAERCPCGPIPEARVLQGNAGRNRLRRGSSLCFIFHWRWCSGDCFALPQMSCRWHVIGGADKGGFASRGFESGFQAGLLVHELWTAQLPFVMYPSRPSPVQHPPAPKPGPKEFQSSRSTRDDAGSLRL